MPVSRLDKAYRKLVLSKFFTKGWGKPENLKKLFEFRKIVSDRRLCYPLVSPNHPVVITKEVDSKDTLLLEGHFLSPFDQHLPDLLPKEARKAHFQVLLPKKWESSHYKPVCLHLAGTGDHFFFRRRNLMAKPLLKEAGIGAILLENPFYGLRKPKDQVWSCLHNVSDIFVMGGCLILESLVLFHWCKRMGLGPFGLTGISMGGHMASLAATNWPEPLALVPCLSWSTASIVFTRGVMSGAINWDLLEAQYYSNDIYSKEIQRMVKVVDDFLGGSNGLFQIPPLLIPELGEVSLTQGKEIIPDLTASLPDQVNKDVTYAAGQHFAKNFPDSLSDLNNAPATQLKSSTDTKTEPANGSLKDSKDESKEGPEAESNPKDALMEVLEESNLTQYARVVERNTREELTTTPISIRDYLAFRSKPEVAARKVDLGEEEREAARQQASRFMCGIMDECTHLSNFSVPVDPELIISVAAVDDAYVPRDGITDVRDIWKGAEVRYLNAGHVGAYLLHQKVFRKAITDAFAKLKEKHHPSDP